MKDTEISKKNCEAARKTVERRNFQFLNFSCEYVSLIRSHKIPQLSPTNDYAATDEETHTDTYLHIF